MHKQPRSVFIIPGFGMGQIGAMFKKEGWSLVDDIEDADLVQFTGGEDVSPTFYGEFVHKTTHCKPERDQAEEEWFKLAVSLGLPMAGICRGGQFLNVMNGGSLYQDVDNHVIGGTHTAFINADMVEVQVTSTHHQMMRPNFVVEAECHVLMTAGLSTKKVYMSMLSHERPFEVVSNRWPNTSRSKDDVEAVYYGKTNCLCYQPHPEFELPEAQACRALYFKWIEEYLFSWEQPRVEEDKSKALVIVS